MTPAPRRLLALALTLFLGACVGNGYRKFYRPEVDAFDATNHVVALQDGEAPELVASADPVAEVRRLRAAGYVQLGTSAFSGPAGSTQQIVAQARQIGATKVVHCRNYEETVSGSIATPSTTLTSGSVSGCTFSATSTSFDGGIPYRVRRYEQRAWFLARSTEKPRVGVSVRDLTEADRVGAGRNRGAAIELVYDGTPAFAADLVPGDVIVAVDGTAVGSRDEATAALRAIPGDRTGCELTIVRRGEERRVVLSL